MNKIILNKIDVQQKKIIYSYSIEGNLKKYFKNIIYASKSVRK